MTRSSPASRASRSTTLRSLPRPWLKGKKSAALQLFGCVPEELLRGIKKNPASKRPVTNHPYAAPGAAAGRTHASLAPPLRRSPAPRVPGKESTEPTPGTETAQSPQHRTAPRGGRCPSGRTDRRERWVLRSDPRPRCSLPELGAGLRAPAVGTGHPPSPVPHGAGWSTVPGSPGPHLHSSDGDGGTRALGEGGHGLGGTAGRSDVVHRHVHLGKTDGHGVKTIQPRGSPHPQNPAVTPPDPTTSLCPRKGAVCQPAAGTSDAASEATSDTPMCEPGPGT